VLPHHLHPSAARKGAETVGDDTEVVTAVLTAVDAQPAIDVFTLTISANKERNLVIPRHHLPVFIVESRKARTVRSPELGDVCDGFGTRR